MRSDPDRGGAPRSGEPDPPSRGIRSPRLLRPATLSPLRVFSILAATGAIVLLGAAGFVGRWSQSHADAGIRWTDHDGALIVAEVRPGGPGDRAGLQPQDQLLSLGDYAVESPLDARAWLWGAEPGKSLPVVVERDGHRLSLGLVPEQASDDLRLYTYLFLVGLLFVVLSTTLVLRLPLGGVGVPYFLLG